MKLRVMIEDQSYEVEVGDVHSQPILAVVDGETFEIWTEENGIEAQGAVPVLTAPVSESAAQISSDARLKAVLAPIPGVIIAVSVKVGESVSFGQELCVLEAMKMKNAIRANRSGTIGAIEVAVGDQVNHSQVLMEYTD